LLDAMAFDDGSGDLAARLRPPAQATRDAGRHASQALIDRLVAAGVSTSRCSCRCCTCAMARLNWSQAI